MDFPLPNRPGVSLDEGYLRLSPAGWTLVALVPLLPPALAAWTFSRGRTRWPRAGPALYLPLSFTSYIVLGLTR